MAKACCDGEDFKLPGSIDDQVSTLCKALAHPSRVKIMRTLAKRGECICGDLVEEIDLAQSTISEHLRILKEARLVEGSIDGPKRCYCINQAAMKFLKALIQKL